MPNAQHNTSTSRPEPAVSRGSPPSEIQKLSILTGIFMGKVLLCYALLIAPWPHFNATYGAYLRELGRTVFADSTSHWLILFGKVPAEAHSPLDTRITVSNRDLLDASGHGPASLLDLDTRGVGWIPTALVISLALASPVPFGRKLLALALGLAAIHAYILFALGIYIANEASNSSALQLIDFAPWVKSISAGLEETMITQLGASFVVPVFIWLAATFRRKDWHSLFQAFANSSLAPSPDGHD